MIVWGWRIFRGKGSPLYPRLSWLLAVLGLSATLLVALYEVETGSTGFDFGGGVAGRWIAGYLIVGVGDIGSYILVSLVLLLSTMAIDRPEPSSGCRWSGLDSEDDQCGSCLSCQSCRKYLD